MIPRVMAGSASQQELFLCLDQEGMHMFTYAIWAPHDAQCCCGQGGSAVLIRSCAPVSASKIAKNLGVTWSKPSLEISRGLEIIQQRRHQQTEKPILLSGPGKAGQALGLSTDWSNHALHTPGGLEVLDGPEAENILVGPRVGIEYTSPEHIAAPWGFAIAGTPWIGAPKNTLRPW